MFIYGTFIYLAEKRAFGTSGHCRLEHMGETLEQEHMAEEWWSNFIIVTSCLCDKSLRKLEGIFILSDGFRRLGPVSWFVAADI